MKYLKYTVALFIFALMLSTLGVNAKQYNIDNITIPVFSGIWNSGQKEKETFGPQQIKKISCTDSLTGDGRVILARTYSYYDPVGYSSWIEVPYSYASWGASNQNAGAYRLELKSNKSLPTTAKFNGVWQY